MSEYSKQLREDRAVEALICLALRQDTMTDEELSVITERYLTGPVQLSPEDEAALDRCKPEFLKAMREEVLRRGVSAPPNDKEPRAKQGQYTAAVIALAKSLAADLGPYYSWQTIANRIVEATTKGNEA